MIEQGAVYKIMASSAFGLLAVGEAGPDVIQGWDKLGIIGVLMGLIIWGVKVTQTQAAELRELNLARHRDADEAKKEMVAVVRECTSTMAALAAEVRAGRAVGGNLGPRA